MTDSETQLLIGSVAWMLGFTASIYKMVLLKEYCYRY